ncbi:MAG: DMT family transporter [Pyrinomonadaceae bacterium]|nr:DMT family transporter [Pyrinomonadaceae bacterium]
MKLFLTTIFALVCFALNSILCRLALKTDEIDAASFTAIRLVAGAVMLFFINFFTSRDKSRFKSGNWSSAFYLFLYAICFSFAYVSLTTGNGALVLFGTVQFTLIAAALYKGERPHRLEWFGFVLAFGGLIYLILPGLSAPPLLSSVLMFSAGVAWGFYTLNGRNSTNPIADTAGNFLRSVPFAVPVLLLFLPQTHLSSKGILLAVLSGAVASGIGYVAWYAILKFHTATRAGILQISVPALAALGGVLFLGENLSFRLISASCLILGGVALAIFGRKK